MRKQELYVWAEDTLLSDEVDLFLHFCKREGKDPEDVISYEEFLKLKKEFEQ
ncbi:hypothetical protein IJL65_03260 [bacterium]|nr:hypothetical protein [bacterium]